jgi:hypothetical protein
VDAALAALLELEVLDDVGDVDVGARDAYTLERLVELAARRPDEDPAGAVLAIARHLPHHRHRRLLHALAEDRLRGRPVEVAAAALRGGLAQRLQALARGKEGGGVAAVLGSGHVPSAVPAARARANPAAGPRNGAGQRAFAGSAARRSRLVMSDQSDREPHVDKDQRETQEDGDSDSLTYRNVDEDAEYDERGEQGTREGSA